MYISLHKAINIVDKQETIAGTNTTATVLSVFQKLILVKIILTTITTGILHFREFLISLIYLCARHPIKK